MNKKTTMVIAHLHAAVIDVGSRSHFVAIGQGKKDVKDFVAYNEIWLHSRSCSLIITLLMLLYEAQAITGRHFSPPSNLNKMLWNMQQLYQQLPETLV